MITRRRFMRWLGIGAVAASVLTAGLKYDRSE
jgi:hypothetical protein